MISLMEAGYTSNEVRGILNNVVRTWFFSKFEDFSLPQLYGVLEVHNKNNILISAPTGGTKTLTSFLSILNELINLAERNELEDRVYCVYVSPLKALNNDVKLNLIEPLEEMEKLAGKNFGIRIAVRTGDTTIKEKTDMLKKSPHILITTPESLAILLSSYKFIEHLKFVDYAIVDEIHALANSKRGVHLSLSLERLQNLSKEMTRIGLSATISPLEEIAKFLVGNDRDCKIADVRFMKKFDLKVISPVNDFINISQERLHKELYDMLDNLIQEHKTTLIFTNTRSGTERVVHHLKEKFPKKYTENIGAHHGSLSKAHRLDIETRLREGKLKAVVCLEGNSKILNSNGSWIKIKELDNGKVASLNKKFRLNNNRVISKITKENQDSLIKIKTSLGKEMICTKEHKFLTISNKGEMIWKEAKNLNKLDYVGTIRKYNHKKLSKKELNLLALNNYPDKRYLELKNSFLREIRDKIVTEHKEIKLYWQKELKCFIAYSTFLHDLRGEFLFRIEIIKKIIKDFNIAEEKLWGGIIGFSSHDYKSKRLEISKDLMRLLGFMSAEGYISDEALYISNKDPKLLEYYGNLIKKLAGRKPFKKLSSSGTSILCWESVFLSKFLQNLGFKKGRKSRINSIPGFIFSLPNSFVFSFISGYLDGDGFPETKRDGRTYAIGFSTTSKEMANDLMYLLLRQGIVSSIRSKYINKTYQLLNGRKIIKNGWFYDIVVIGGEHLRSFLRQTNPIRENLKKARKTLLLRGYSNLDVIPNLGKKLRFIRNQVGISSYRLYKERRFNPIKYELNNRFISRKQLKKLLSIYKNKDIYLINLLNSDIFWERVKSKIKVNKERFVYNIEVKNDHNYIANGFITKNCSTSLELGIDIGYIDLVSCLGSPKSVARALQRFGRSGHKLHEKVKGRMIVMDRDDLVECSVLLKDAIEKKIDRISIPKNCLDVLAQQIDGMAIERVWNIKEMFKVIKKSYCYKELSWEDFIEVINYLAGEYISLEDRNIYAKIWYDKESEDIGRKGRMTRVIYMTNIGTIPDETNVVVKAGEQVVGTIDSGFLERLKQRDNFVLGGNVYEFKFSRGMVAQVSASANAQPTVPSWFSEMLPLSFDLAMDIQKFRRYMQELFVNDKSKEEIIKFINEYLYVDENAANAIYEYFNEQYRYLEIPHDKKLLIEFYKDEHDKKYAIFHGLYGRRVNDVLSRAVAYAISRLQHRDVEIGINDNGFYLASNKNIQVVRAFNLLKAEELRKVMEKAIDKSEVLKRRFRHCATRALMILRTYKGKKKNVGRQQVSSMILMSAVKRISNDFSILKEARREVLEELMDIENAVKILEMIKDKKIEIKEVHTDIPSPFAFNLITQGYADIMKMEDKIEFIRRMHQNVLAKIGKG